jgi:site-specific DNA recombinase
MDRARGSRASHRAPGFLGAGQRAPADAKARYSSGRSREPFWARQRPRFLITGLAKCGECGSSYVKISANLFGCAAARNRGTYDNRLNIRLDIPEGIILDGLRHRLMEPELFKAFCEEFHRELNRLRNEESAALATKRAELDQVERRIRRIVDLITDDDAPLRALKQELTTLEARHVSWPCRTSSQRRPRRRHCSTPTSPRYTGSA